MSTYPHPLRPRRAGARLLAGALVATVRHVSNWLRATTLTAAAAALVLATVTMPASAGTMQVSGIGAFNMTCQPPAGSPPADLGDYPPVDLIGSLDGCWYTYVSASKFNPSGTYIEQGTEIFVGCLNGTACGTFETTYTFTAKYVDDSFTEEIHGRCHHPIVGGTGDFAGVKGVINFKDDVVNLKYDYRGHISLAPPGVQDSAKDSAKVLEAVESTDATRSGC